MTNMTKNAAIVGLVFRIVLLIGTSKGRNEKCYH